MSYDEYWYGDPLAARVYAKAEEYRREKENYSAWLQGLYMSWAISGTIGNAFIGENTPPFEYPDKPIPTTEEATEMERQENERKEAEQAKIYMRLLVEQGKGWGKEAK